MRLLPIPLLALVFAVTPVAMAARQEPVRSPRNASYTLEVRLDAVNRQLLGRGRLVWRNTSARPASELRFHLYWNAWRDEGSTWMREERLSGRRPLADRRDDERGSIDLSSLTTAGSDLLSAARFVAPDDGNADDRTVLEVPLSQPVAPGASIELSMSWNAHVPRTFDRTGVIGNTYFIAQWFPKIGVLEDTGWNCHQFHASTEFFADFGVYDVSMTVPTGWIVGATGQEVSKTTNGDGSATHRYFEQDVHDFAWTTSPDYIERRDRFEEPGAPVVMLRLLVQPEHEGQADRHFTAAKAALRYDARHLAPYPYRQLTIVDPVTVVSPLVQGESTGGMEYPTLITAGTRWQVPWSSEDPEGVTVHETSHQFWYGLVATDEVDHAWMDEGLTTFTAARVLQESFPSRFVAVRRYFGGLAAWPYPEVPWTAETRGYRIATYQPGTDRNVPADPSWRYDPATAVTTTYARTALWLATLERLVGAETMDRVLASYFTSGVYGHPGPDDFFATASRVSGQDLNWFFDAVYRRAARFDYAVGDVVTRPTASGAFDNTVVVRRLADGMFPIDVRVTFDDGASVVEHWDGREARHLLRYRRAATVSTVEIDPERVLMLDAWRTNNTWTAHPQGDRAADKWALRWLTWFQHVLLTYAFFT